ncbi:hypothetical protein KEM48_002717 [Puccinia striiformis f. sp. tritici PST-130]|nr:hypothetical protein KEM48_002717 [Puccinia striiformis f. sp. tritici PST-130]
MDTYSNGAYGRIRMFLADLNLVLGCLRASDSYEPAMVGNFNLTAFQQQYHNIPSQSMWKRPTNLKQTELDSRTNEHTVRFPQFQRPANIYDRRNRPQELSHKTTHRRPATSTIMSSVTGPKKTSRELLRLKQKINRSIFDILKSGNLDRLRINKVNMTISDILASGNPRSFEEPHEQHLYLELLDQQPPDSASDVHVFMERPGDGMDDGQYGQAHSDEEINETLDQEEQHRSIKKSNQEAILQPTLLPMMNDDPELAAPNNNPYLEHGADIDSSDHYDFDHHNLYNNNNSGLDSSISDDHYNYDDGQAEDLQDQRAEYEAAIICTMWRRIIWIWERIIWMGEKIIMMEEKIIMMDKEDYYEDGEDNYDGGAYDY